jgi:co-chaperonin GroES (HSP10)
VGVSVNFAPVKFSQTMEEAWPDVDPGTAPFGSRVLVQLRSAKQTTDGGIALTKETRETVQWNQQVGKVRAIGPVAFKNRNTMEPWPEGAWCHPGDFVRIPKFGGDKWEMPLDPKQEQEEDMALFVLVNDLDVLGKVTIDPRDIIAFV